MSEHVVLVDEQDSPIGTQGKVDAHLGEGQLHRAFTALVFDSQGQVLIARRAREKMLWPSYWDNTCASHPRDGEGYAAAGERRLTEELGFTCPLFEVDKFLYHAPFEDVGCEHELCATLIGTYDGEVVQNDDEVADWEWVAVGQLLTDFGEMPEDRYTPWLVIAS